MTQKDRVYQMLKNAGEDGVTTNTFLSSFIPRFSARILELKKEGCDIETIRLRRGQYLYVMHTKPEFAEVKVSEIVIQLRFA